jgi:hypothetical protein
MSHCSDIGSRTYGLITFILRIVQARFLHTKDYIIDSKMFVNKLDVLYNHDEGSFNIVNNLSIGIDSYDAVNVSCGNDLGLLLLKSIWHP